MNEITQAEAVIEREADGRIASAVRAMVSRGEARWVLDPDANGIVVLVKGAHAVAVIDVRESSFEAGSELESLA